MRQEYYLGLDIGGIKCAVSVGEVQGDTIRILERKEVPTTKNPLQTLNGLASYIREYIGDLSN